MLPASAVSAKLGRRFARAIPIWALAECRFSSAWRTSGRCSTSCEGRLTRQFLRQLQTRKLKLFGQVLVGESARQRSQQVTLLRQLLQQRRQGGGDLRELRFLRCHVELARISLRILVPQNLQHVGVDGDEFMGRVNLPPQVTPLEWLRQRRLSSA